MSQRRTLILVAAVVIGAIASLLVYNYVNGVEDEANKNAEQVPVYLVEKKISRGMQGLEAQGLIKKSTVPRKIMPANAITDPADITGQVAISDLVPNQVVVSDMFADASDPRAQQSFAERLNRIQNEDQVAISISVDQVRGVAGLIQPGDFVNVMLTEVSQVDAEGNPVGGPEGKNAEDGLFAQQARYLYQKAEVLAVGQSAVAQPGETAEAANAGTTAKPVADTGLITFIVPAKAAQYIASADPASIYLTLVARDYKPVPQDQIDPSAPIPAEDAEGLTPYGPEGPDSGKTED